MTKRETEYHSVKWFVKHMSRPDKWTVVGGKIKTDEQGRAIAKITIRKAM